MITVKSYPLNEINYSIATPDSTYSYELIKYLWVDVSEAVSDQFIEIVYNGVTTTLLITDECRYIPVDILFQNKEGSIQTLTFFKARKDTMSVEAEKYEGNYGQGRHQFIKYNVNSKSKFSVNSGFVDEDLNDVYKQLLLSQRVWTLENGVAIPLNLASSSLEFKTRQNDRLINYQIDFEYAFNDINNV